MNSEPKILAILNLTPDSFYDGGRHTSLNNILSNVEQFIEEGADIIDIGAYSSRPGAAHITMEEEGKRLFPVLQEIRKIFPNIPISIDTFRSEIAQKSIDFGANIINDISGGDMDEKMCNIIVKNKVQYILMHMKGTPQTMQQNISNENIVREVKNYFQNKLKILEEIGVNNVILDVGFGFGKTLDQNYQLLKHLDDFKTFNKPLLVGLSRKSMLYKLLNAEPKNMLNATSVAHTLALIKGANFLRVHDVKEAKEVITIVENYLK